MLYLSCLFPSRLAILSNKEIGYKQIYTHYFPLNKNGRMFKFSLINSKKKQLNSQIIALIGHADEKQAFNLTDHIAQTWRNSKLFSHITDRIQPNLTALQQDIQLVAFATLPQTVREQLINDPKGYFQQYAEDIVNPFKAK